MREHTHVLNAAVSGLSTLPGTATPFAAARALTRFLHHPDLPFHALLEPAQDALRLAVATHPLALVVHDWCMAASHTHTSKRDRFRRTHATDCGYELGTALVLDATDGHPLGPMEVRLRTADALLGTRPSDTPLSPGHGGEVLGVMDASRRWGLAPTLVHLIDREGDSVGHDRAWHTSGHLFVVRADPDRIVTWNGDERTLSQVIGALGLKFQDVRGADGADETVVLRAGRGRVQGVETAVRLDRPAVTSHRTEDGRKRKVLVPGPPLPLRLVVTRVVSDVGVVLAEWALLTNVPGERADAATIGRWYARRWRIETFHKLLKTAGMNLEQWQQETGAAILRRLCVAVTACLTVWHLQRDTSAEAARLRAVLVRLSGRLMKHRVESTAPALLAGLEKLLALDDLLQTEDLAEILALARKVLPRLLRSG